MFFVYNCGATATLSGAQTALQSKTKMGRKDPKVPKDKKKGPLVISSSSQVNSGYIHFNFYGEKSEAGV